MTDTNEKKGLFEISDEGWIQENRGRPPWQLFREAIQNALDTGSEVWVKVDTRKKQVIVTDRGPGFENLSDAFTIYGGTKSDDPTKRGRFKRGLKEFVAGCDFLKVESTSGSVEFDVKAGVRRESDYSTKEGTRVTAQNDEWTNEDFAELKQYVKSIWAPEHQDIVYEVKGGSQVVISREQPDFTAQWRLETVVYENQEKQKPRRKTPVHIKRANSGNGRLFEMGIPVNIDEDFPYWIDVQQRVPLAEQRNEVDSSFLKNVKSLLLNETHEELSKRDLKAEWVQEAIGHYKCSEDAKETYVKKVIKDGRKKDVVISSSNAADDKARNHGYQVFDTSRANMAVASAVREVCQTADEVAGDIQKRQETKVEPTPAEQETLDRAREIAELLGYQLSGSRYGSLVLTGMAR